MAVAEKSLIALAWTIQRVESPVSQYAPRVTVRKHLRHEMKPTGNMSEAPKENT
jgi:hypothetical protein